MRGKYFGRLVAVAVVLAVAATATGQTENPLVRLETSMGDIYLELFPDDAPISVENFLDYVNRGFYEEKIFHRVVADFVIQAGAFDDDLNNLHSYDPNDISDPNYPIVNESDNDLKNVRGTLAMARTDDPDSATSQFYINLKDNANLDHGSTANPDGYAVFGEVVTGMGVVDAIGAVAVSTQSGMQNVPNAPVYINSATELNPNNVDVLTVQSLQVTAGSHRGADSFILRTTLGLTSSDWQAASTLTLHLGDYSDTINLADFRQFAASGIYLYYQNTPGISLVLANLQAGTMLIMGRQTDLTGVKDPVPVRIIVGDYIALGEAEQDEINNGAGTPLALLQGVEDALRVDRFVHIYVPATGAYYLFLSGSIATALPPNQVDLEDFTSTDFMTVKWKSKTSELKYFERIGDTNSFRHGYGTNIAWAWFNLDTGRFMIFSDTAGSIASPATLTISFDLDDYSFEQVATIR